MIDNFFNPQVETTKKRRGGPLPAGEPATFPKGEGKDAVAPKPRKVIHGKYIVRDGDTLWDISWEFLGTPIRWREIAKLNNVRYGHIEPGDELYIPGRIETCPCCGKMI